VALAASQTAAPGVTERAWQDLDAQWDALTAGRTAPLLGEARLYLAKIDGSDLAAERPLRRALAGLLPAGAQPHDWWDHPVTFEHQVTVWETSARTDDRALRRFVLAFADAADAIASAWAWSRGDAAIPPLARYLLHAAVIRYHLRVWQRDGQTRELRAVLDTLAAQLLQRRETLPPAGDASQADLLRLRRFDALLKAVDLRELRRSVEISADNLALALSAPELLIPGGPFADDRDLARSFLASLDDEVAYLDIAADRAAQVAAMQHEPDAVPPVTKAPPDERTGDDVTRRVFVVHGRDTKARNALFDFLHRLDLLPMEWEMLVADTGVSSPYLGDVIAQAVTRARASVVLLTPDDVVRLHPSLRRSRHENPAELDFAMQARPNVLVELGMALATYPDRTIILMAGSHRPIADLGGLNYIELDDSSECRQKIALRLKLAGCKVNDRGGDWLRPGLFAGLRAYRRKPPDAS
jgi:predicted nucleotide-binding protein